MAHSVYCVNFILEHFTLHTKSEYFAQPGQIYRKHVLVVILNSVQSLEQTLVSLYLIGKEEIGAVIC